MEDFKTPGVRNIEKRHSAAGGAHTHTPAGGTKMGDENSTQGRQETEKGMSSKYFQENFGNQGPEVSLRAEIPHHFNARILHKARRRTLSILL